MIKEALEYILKLKDKEQMDVNGDTYIKAGTYYKVTEPLLEDKFDTFTLKSVVEYIKGNVDEDHAADKCVIHIVSPESVILYSGVHEEIVERKVLLKAHAITTQLSTDVYMDTEEFIIQLQSKFIDQYDRDTLIKLAGNIVDESEVTRADNGMSQNVTAKTGIATVANIQVVNPFRLAPYRTFAEIEQPSSPYIFRIRKGGYCALYHTGDKKWFIEAVESIYDYLSEALADEIENEAVVIIR